MENRISIVTITLDDDPWLIADNVGSVRGQATSFDIEHILVEGGSRKHNDTLRHIDSSLKIYNQAPAGIYSAINYGLCRTSGGIIGLVHGSDRLASDDVAETVGRCFSDHPEVDFIYGDIVYARKVSAEGPRELVRRYSGSRFRPDLLKYGVQPPHPSLFIRRSAMDKIGLYNEKFVICGDFDYWLRLFSPGAGLCWKYLPKVMVEMSPGGISSKWSNRLRVSFPEKLRALRENGICSNPLMLLWRVFYL